MKIGVFATFMSPQATSEMIRTFGRDAEAAGLDSIWMGEHVVLFDEMEFGYPGSADGRIPVPAGGGMLDTVATFGLLAGVTERIRFGTGITLIPQRNPIYTAKEFATLDWLSGGRMDLGIGVGWCKEEVLGCGSGWQDRGKRCDEFLTLIKRLWTEEIVHFEGEFISVPGARLDPKPQQAPLPMIVGGHTARGLRRAAEFGDGWYGFALPVDATRDLLVELDTALAAAGRSRDGFEIVITPPYRVDADMVKAFEDLGVDRLVVQLGSQKPESVQRKLEELNGLVTAVG